jgi:hypothetical protein
MSLTGLRASAKLLFERVQNRRFPMYIEASYVVYLAISIGVTVWVARTLHKNGRVFLIDAFRGNVELAGSVNHLLVVGFYLINVGYVVQGLSTDGDVGTLRAAMELVSDKLGTILLVLGGLHFFNIYVFHRLRQRGEERMENPPVEPDHQIPPIGGSHADSLRHV